MRLVEDGGCLGEPIFLSGKLDDSDLSCSYLKVEMPD
jgi:hypothetical protein